MPTSMVTGVTRHFRQTLDDVRRVIDRAPGHHPFGIHLLVGRNHTVFMADTTVNERPTAEQLADIAEQTAAVARRMGQEPRVAFLSYSTFGNPTGDWLDNIREAVAVLDGRQVSFEYEGEMAPDVALNPAMAPYYPFSRLSGPANVLVMPGLQSANLSAKLLKELGGDAVIGPMLVNMEQPGADRVDDLDRVRTGDAGGAGGGGDRALKRSPSRPSSVRRRSGGRKFSAA